MILQRPWRGVPFLKTLTDINAQKRAPCFAGRIASQFIKKTVSFPALPTAFVNIAKVIGAIVLLIGAVNQALAEPNLPVTVVPGVVVTASATNQSDAGTNAAPRRDLAAAKFITSCAGCHSLLGLKLTGPELSHVASWAPDALKQAIKRMEKNVGPLPENDIVGLSELLRDKDVRERLKVEEARIQAQFMAKIDPPNAIIGKNLFLGIQPLANAGLACSSCHTAAGKGGNLGPDLTGAFAKMGQLPLVSAIEKASFKVMASHYRDHPVTKQEAMHLAQYFSTLDPKNIITPGTPFAFAGAGTAFAMLVGLGFYFRSRRVGRDIKLQRRR